MTMNLAENIRAFRKDRSLTQEQLSEVLGVTAGAVYKWEAGLSVPDIELIVQMADFFDTSVDVLLGYEMKDNRLDATVKRLQEYRRQKDMTGLAEAEKALKKYPHSFRIVNECATVYRVFGIERGDKALTRRALALLERSLLRYGVGHGRSAPPYSSHSPFRYPSMTSISTPLRTSCSPAILDR